MNEKFPYYSLSGEDSKNSFSAKKRILISKLVIGLSLAFLIISQFHWVSPIFFGLGSCNCNKNFVTNLIKGKGNSVNHITSSNLDKDLLFDTFLKALETNLSGNWSQKYTSEPHLAGTNYGLVEWTEKKFKEYGLQTEIDDYDVYVSYPNEQSLKLIKTTKSDKEVDEVVYKPSLKEDQLEQDVTTTGEGLVPTFLVYGANGNVTAEYVYVNYGTKKDFELLASQGVDVKGKITIARYGAIFRGLKVKFAQEAGAIGMLLYLDPGDDNGITPENGYKTYPDGPARNPSSVQRGSVQFITFQPGDPTTPGFPSKGDNIEREDPHGAIGEIPVLTISYREIKPILSKLNGHGIRSKKIGGEDWVGALPDYDYYVGPNPNFKLNLYSDQIYNITPLWNVYGTIVGNKKDEIIILGNHRDSWTKGGAGDPNSGSSVMIEIIRGFNELLKIGWKPERTIMFASWDGEEYGLSGSTEFGEYLEKDLQKKVVAYLNLDIGAIGSLLTISSSPLLNNLIRDVSKNLPYPEGGTLYEHFVKESGDIIHDLGACSDFDVFQERLGIPSLDMMFARRSTDSIYHYHSNYDSFYWMSNFGDPDFVYHNLMAKYLGSIILQLSERPVLGFRLSDYTEKLKHYYDEAIDKIPEDWKDRQIMLSLKDDLQENDKLDEITKNTYSSSNNLISISKCHKKGKQVDENSNLDKTHKILKLSKLIKKLEKSIVKFNSIAYSFDNEASFYEAQAENPNLPFWKKIKLYFIIKGINKKLQYFDRNFLYYPGLKDRPWFRHIVLASDRYIGYEPKTLPGLNEAIEDLDFDETVKWLRIILKIVKRTSKQLN
ncbi:hypothetical protein PACTADRAFT_63658 [Pachysolen tannophilus NRRL Y-2460]|uniref:Uncharacterized protein n=1 Tax=Pachysolen tannophilus NRRL Y-2460 TaxID=669874 RepID=A0A1E4U1V9_PACTA|nr:hypothetical protein PACTADRAFT_63658 [Pachysolen tannophilus NRRL Y-2460]